MQGGKFSQAGSNASASSGIGDTFVDLYSFRILELKYYSEAVHRMDGPKLPERRDRDLMHELSQEQDEMKPSVIQGLAPVNGTHLSYELVGQGHPLVFVQGSASLGMYTWDDQFLPFSSFYQVLRYDIRGRGKSSDPGQPLFNSG
jgi:hypothetical protein